MNKKNKMGLILALAGLAGNVMAGTLSSFTTGDLLICFRNGNDLVVDAGPITGSSLIGSPIGSTNNITAYTAANFDTISLNGLNWSAIAYGSDGSLYITKAREDLNQYDANYLVSSPSMQSSPWNPVGGNPSQQLTGPVGSMVAGAARAGAAGCPTGAGSPTWAGWSASPSPCGEPRSTRSAPSTRVSGSAAVRTTTSASG